MGQIEIESIPEVFQTSVHTSYTTPPYFAQTERFELSQYGFGDRLAQPTLECMTVSLFKDKLYHEPLLPVQDSNLQPLV